MYMILKQMKGMNGMNGINGMNGMNGMNGINGTDGMDRKDGEKTKKHGNFQNPIITSIATNILHRFAAVLHLLAPGPGRSSQYVCFQKIVVPPNHPF